MIVASYPGNDFLTTHTRGALPPGTQNDEEESGSSHQVFNSNAPFLHDGGYKTNRIIKSFSKETRK